MKKNYFYILTLLFLSGMTVSFAQLPNGDFENWSLNSYGILDPVGWTTYNFGAATCVQYQPAQHDSFAVKLMSDTSQGFFLPGSIECYFLSAQKPLSLDGYYQTFFANGDLLSMSLYLYAAQNIVASGSLDITSNANTYTSFSIPLTYTSSTQPDSAVFLVFFDNANTNNLSGYAILDNLSFTGSTGVDEVAKYFPVKLWPNPASDYIHAAVTGFDLNKTTVRIMDFSGRVIQTEVSPETFSTDEKFINVNTSLLDAGFYLISLTDKNKTASKPFIVTH